MWNCHRWENTTPDLKTLYRTRYDQALLGFRIGCKIGLGRLLSPDRIKGTRILFPLLSRAESSTFTIPSTQFYYFKSWPGFESCGRWIPSCSVKEGINVYGLCSQMEFLKCYESSQVRLQGMLRYGARAPPPRPSPLTAALHRNRHYIDFLIPLLCSKVWRARVRLLK